VPLRCFRVVGFRNLVAQDLPIGEGLTVVVGANGVGKTNLLEALTVFGNLASFRAGPATNWFCNGQRSFALAGTVERAGVPVEIRQEATLTRIVSRALYRGGRRLASAEYLGLFPIASFSGDDRLLIWGPPEERRRFLDRLSFHLNPEALEVMQGYRRALAQRNALLSTGGVDDEFDAFEHNLARLGAAIIQFRLVAIGGLERHIGAELDALGWPAGRPNLRYHCHDGVAVADPATTTAGLRTALAVSRRRDRVRGHTTVGPHRHDLVLAVQGAPARETLSAGQGKLLATALKLTAVMLLDRARGQSPMVVFDDLDAELDAAVLQRLLGRLGARGQAVLSSAHEEMVRPRLAAAAVWRMNAGRVTVVGPERSVV
jgi:DNA replication and repair protein RecF